MVRQLTAAQIARFPEYVERWTAIGLSCEPLDEVRAKTAVCTAYAASGLPPPVRWVVCDNPMSGAITASMLREGVSMRNSVWNSVETSVRDSVRNSVWNSVRDSVYGSHDAGWLSFHAFFREVCKLRVQTEPLVGLLELSQVCGWWIPYEHVCILQHRHCGLHRDPQGRLHNETGMAVQYQDGWGVYAIHGMPVPMEVVEYPDAITVKRIEREPNVELRRIMIAQYDRIRVSGRFLLDSGAEVIHRDEWGTLYRKDMSGDEPLMMVQVVNGTLSPDGTSHEFFLRVDPQLRPIGPDGATGLPQELTARNAVASTYGKRGPDYRPARRT